MADVAKSLPSRERGLKFHRLSQLLHELLVAPFAGAWIEIQLAIRADGSLIFVAPFAGAWIEIALQSCLLWWHWVAPFAGAWIEIGFDLCAFCSDFLSLPSRERGLKCNKCRASSEILASLPSRERGLKCLAGCRHGSSTHRRSLRGSVD